MEGCLEGKYGDFNVELWNLCQREPQDGGFTVDQWLDLRDLRFRRQANQSEYTRMAIALNHLRPTCGTCGFRNSPNAEFCVTCKTSFQTSSKPSKKA